MPLLQGIVIENTLLRNIQLPDRVAEAIEEKLKRLAGEPANAVYTGKGAV